MLLVFAAQAMPLVVWNPEQVPDVEHALAAYWPGSELVVESGPVAEVPRFELTFDALFWITADGVIQRPVETADTAVLLARSWVTSGPPEDLGWVPQVVAPPAPAPPVEPPRPKRAVLDDIWFGFGIRHGWPAESGIRGLGPVVGVRRGQLLGRLQASSKTRSIRVMQVEQFRDRGYPDFYDTRYGVALHVGLTTAPQRVVRGLSVEAFSFLGPEAQQFVRFEFGEAEEDIAADLPGWDVGIQVGGGAAVRVQRVGLRSLVLLDLRDRLEPWQRSGCVTTAVVFHL